MNYDPSITPLDLVELYWPHVRLYSKQREMLMSVRESVETVVVACNGSGKDYLFGGVCVLFFKFPWVFFPEDYVAEVERFRTPGDNPHTRRIVTTSVRGDHLDVLWGSIGWWVRTCKMDLGAGEDGIVMLDKEIRFKRELGSLQEKNLQNYLVGTVSKAGEGLAGHHAAYTLGMVDEASGMSSEVYKRFRGWTKRLVMFGNAEPCENEFKHNFSEGDVLV